MDDWGRHPDVALFVGGPRHGDIENISGFQEIQVAEPEVFYSLGSVTPQYVNTRMTRYVREKVVLPNGLTATIMRDETQDPVRSAQVAQSEWAFRANWQSVWATPVPLNYRWLPKPRKSPEEAVAWLHDGKGRDFL